MSTIDVTQLSFYETLARLMNAEPDRYRILGDADMTAVFSITRPDGDALHVQLVFEGLACEAVDAVHLDEAKLADFRLEGPVSAWQAMFDDIAANGRASGAWTINSLALRGDLIRCEGEDPMGLDKFSRFNQTLQEFLDGAGRLEPARSHA